MVSKDKLVDDLEKVKPIAEFLAISHDKTRLQWNEYIKEAGEFLELLDLLHYRQVTVSEDAVKALTELLTKVLNDNHGKVSMGMFAKAVLEADYHKGLPEMTDDEISHIQNALLNEYKDEWCSHCESICVKLGIELRPGDLQTKPTVT